MAFTSTSPASKYAGAKFNTLQLVMDCWSLVSGSHSATVDWFCSKFPIQSSPTDPRVTHAHAVTLTTNASDSTPPERPPCCLEVTR